MRCLVSGAAAPFASHVSALAATATGESAAPGNVAGLRNADRNDGLWGGVSGEQQPDAARQRDAAKRGRATLGSPILLVMKQVQANRGDGDIHNASNGKVYMADIPLKSGDVLHIAGSSLRFFCGSEDCGRANASNYERNSLQLDPPVCENLSNSRCSLLECRIRQAKSSKCSPVALPIGALQSCSFNFQLAPLTYDRLHYESCHS